VGKKNLLDEKRKGAVIGWKNVVSWGRRKAREGDYGVRRRLKKNYTRRESKA